MSDPSIVRFRRRRGRPGRARGPPRGGQRPQRVPGRRRRHRRQHGAHAARRARRSSTGWPAPRRTARSTTIGRDEIVASVARAALLGARGNSGVILSQLIRGAAEELASRPGELVDPVLIGAALARAADQAYGSVREPGRGHDPHRGARDGPPRRLRARPHAATPGSARMPPPSEQNARHRRGDRARAGGRARTRSSAARTCCPMLREAGVVDAGGYGLTVLLAGIVGALRGAERAGARASRGGPGHAPPARLDAPTATARTSPSPAATSSSASFIHALERLGDSVLVVGDPTTLKVHVHTDDPDAATALFADAGVGLAPRRRRHARAGPAARRAARRRRSAARRCGALAVVTGDGHARAVRGPRRARARRRPDAQPLDLRPARRDPRHPRRGGRRAAQQRERGHGRRARRRAVRQDGRGRARRARRRPGWPPRSASIRTRGADANARGDARDARARPHRRGRPGGPRRRPGPLPRRARRSASSRTRSSPGGSRARRCATCSSSWPRTPS